MRKILLSILLGIIQIPLFAQYDLTAPVPLNPLVRVGKLSNGLTYYICRNTNTLHRAEFDIIQNVGSLLENDDQNGLAHFLEHMAFSGTKHFPGNQITETLKKYGIKMGSHLNASTSYNETVYKLGDIPTDNDGLIDTCLLILHDWSHYISLDDDKMIDKERKVIIEEERMTSDVGKRLGEKSRPVLLKGSKYAKHNVIGDLDIIRNFKKQTLIDYYHDWYRPDLQAIAVIGDIDVDQIEKKIIDLFSKIPVVENAKQRPFFPVPLKGGISYVLAVDKEVPYSFISLNILSEGTKPEMKNHGYMKEVLVEALYNQMLKARIGKILQQKNNICLAADSKMGPLVRGYKLYSVSVTTNPNLEAKALEIVYKENERVKRYGFTGNELEEAKKMLLASFQSMYDQKEKITNGQLMTEIQMYFLENEPAPGFDYYYRFAKAVIPEISVKDVSDKAKQWITQENMVISVAGPKDAMHMTKSDVLAVMKKVERMDIEPYESVQSEEVNELISEELEGGKVVQASVLPTLGATEWVLNNGAHVLFRKADYEKKQVNVMAYSKGGTSLYGNDLLPSAMMLNKLMPAYGLGDLNVKKLNQYLLGKEVSFGVNLGPLSESVSGNSNPENVETLMQLIYLCFEKPRFDKTAYELMMQQAKLSISSSVMNDSLQMILNNYHPRVLLYNQQLLDQVSFDKVEQIYRDRIQDASDFIFFIVGNVEEEQVKPLVEKYIGSLKSTYRKENWKDNGVRSPRGITKKIIKLNGEENKASVIVVYSKEMAYNVKDNFYFGIYQAIQRQRCMQSIREEAGGTYNVNLQGNSERDPYSVYNMSVSFDCDPDRVDELRGILYREIDRMITDGPTQEELVQVIIALRGQYEQSKLHNSYWMNALTMQSLYGIDVTDPKNYDEIIDHITPKDIQDFVKRLFMNINIMDITFVSRKK
ncbi:MAG TPA: insulinase family protein [Butyricimonas virosa]|uniref:Insulinase family protein n=1 Tax=Butyricimonas virosa TaxID=544645 RepID=A0A921H5N1_9BACT|nr:insulinase family protein [Butyricimonas virosa]